MSDDNDKKDDGLWGFIKDQASYIGILAVFAASAVAYEFIEHPTDTIKSIRQDISDVFHGTAPNQPGKTPAGP